MRALVWTAKDTVEMRGVPEPQPAAGEVLVSVRCASVCGSDVMIVAGKHPRARTPLVLGHEFMGVVTQVPGGNGTGVAVGQRVTVEPLLACGECRPCRAGLDHVCERLRLLGVETDGGFAEFVKVPAERVHPVPDSFSDEVAALIEPLAVAVHAVELAPPGPDDFVVILGGGPIGLLIAQVARAGGASRIVLAELDGFRLELAGKLGFDTIDAKTAGPAQKVMDLTDDFGADVTFDAVGVPTTAELLIPLTGIRGRIVVVGIHKKAAAVNFQQLTYREHTILGSRIYARGNFRTAIELVDKAQVDLAPLITHTFDLEQAEAALGVAQRGQDCCKILVKP